MTRLEEDVVTGSFWEEQMAARNQLIKKHGGNFAEFAASLPQLYQVFYRDAHGTLTLKDRKVVCIDEGTTGGLHIAGSGILEGVEATVAMLQPLEVDEVNSHARCGAAALFAQIRGIHTDDPDSLGIEFAAEVAQRLGARHHHIRAEQLRRPKTMHNATIIYYGGVKAFDPAQLPELPPGFVITRALRQNAQPAQTEVDVACKIAFGDHGFGSRFTPESPLIIVPVANPHRPHLSLESLTAELQPVVQVYDKRVKISGFTSPY